MSEQGKIAAMRAATYAVDGLSAFAVIGSLVQILPPLAASWRSSGTSSRSARAGQPSASSVGGAPAAAADLGIDDDILARTHSPAAERLPGVFLYGH